MKLSNFKYEKSSSIGCYFASVDVETGVLFWKKKERKRILGTSLEDWYFAENGEYIPYSKIRRALLVWVGSSE